MIILLYCTNNNACFGVLHNWPSYVGNIGCSPGISPDITMTKLLEVLTDSEQERDFVLQVWNVF